MGESHDERAPIILAPGQGRRYEMGGMTAIFKADRAESAGGYNISEWRLEPNAKGPPVHDHPEDDVFFVIEGTMHFLTGEAWFETPQAKAPFSLLKFSSPAGRLLRSFCTVHRRSCEFIKVLKGLGMLEKIRAREGNPQLMRWGTRNAVERRVIEILVRNIQPH